jgi:hypothetical protein
MAVEQVVGVFLAERNVRREAAVQKIFWMGRKKSGKVTPYQLQVGQRVDPQLKMDTSTPGECIGRE